MSLETRSHFTSKYERMMAEEKRRLGRVQAEKRRELQEQLRKPPTVFLSEANQQFIMNLLKDQTEEESPKSATEVERLRGELIQMGFPESGANEAAQKCDTLSACLDWCCIHLPDPQLPQAFRATGKQLDVIHSARGIQDSAFRFLVDCGFSAEDVRIASGHTSALETCLSELTSLLLNTTFRNDTYDNSVVETEIEALKAIFNQDEDSHIIQQITILNSPFLRYQCTVDSKAVSLWIILSPLFGYPKRPPVVYLHSGQIPDRIRLAFTCVVYERYSQDCEGVLYEVLSDMESILQEAVKRAESIPTCLMKVSMSVEKSAKPSDITSTHKAPLTSITASKPHRTNHSISKNRLFGNPTPEVVNQRKSLPIASYRDDILEMVRKSQVCLLNGGTGCGKSTQVPQFLLEDFRDSHYSTLNILVCEPRRISCLGLYNRVLEEQGFEEGVMCPVGYQVRGDSK